MHEQFPPPSREQPKVSAPEVTRADTRRPGFRPPVVLTTAKARMLKQEQRAAKKAQRQRRKASRKGGAR